MALVEAMHRHYERNVEDLILRTTHPYDTTLHLIVEHFQKMRKRLNRPQIACFYEQKWSDLNKILSHGGQKVRMPGLQQMQCSRLTSVLDIPS